MTARTSGLFWATVTWLVASTAHVNGAPPQAAQAADVIFIGEQHDNPAHHALQAEWTATLAPAALVFEMLTPEQAERITPANRTSQDELAVALDWATSGWPDFAMYYPIFAAAPGAVIYGAGVPRDQVQGAMREDIVSLFGSDSAGRFGLDQPLPEAEQAAREQMQAEAHCDALPPELLPMMVSIQRLRDATLARAALTAHQDTGGPVIVITGNGHARADWGAPHYLDAADPTLSVFAFGQGEGGIAPAGTFSGVVDGPVVDRGNPCDAFN